MPGQMETKVARCVVHPCVCKSQEVRKEESKDILPGHVWEVAHHVTHKKSTGKL